MSYCHLGAANLQALAPGLQGCKSLVKLLVEYNMLGDAGAESLAEAMPALPALQEVDAGCSDGLPLRRHDALQPLVQWMHVEA